MAGINDPQIKLLVTGLNFFILYLLNVSKHTRTYVRICSQEHMQEARCTARDDGPLSGE